MSGNPVQIFANDPPMHIQLLGLRAKAPSLLKKEVVKAKIMKRRGMKYRVRLYSDDGKSVLYKVDFVAGEAVETKFKQVKWVLDEQILTPISTYDKLRVTANLDPSSGSSNMIIDSVRVEYESFGQGHRKEDLED